MVDNPNIEVNNQGARALEMLSSGLVFNPLLFSYIFRRRVQRIDILSVNKCRYMADMDWLGSAINRPYPIRKRAFVHNNTKALYSAHVKEDPYFGPLDYGKYVRIHSLCACICVH